MPIRAAEIFVDMPPVPGMSKRCAKVNYSSKLDVIKMIPQAESPFISTSRSLSEFTI